MTFGFDMWARHTTACHEVHQAARRHYHTMPDGLLYCDDGGTHLAVECQRCVPITLPSIAEEG